jgi:hypothetical protein
LFAVLLTYNDRKFADVPAGVYDVELVGVENAKPFDGPSRYGRANSGPRLLWRFRITTGPLVGQDLVQFTGTEILPKTGLLRLLTMLLGRQLVKGEQVDPATMIRFRYRASWAINPDSDAGRCHIASLTPSTACTTPSNTTAAPSNAGAMPSSATTPPSSSSAATSSSSAPPRPLTPVPTEGALFEVELRPGEAAVTMSRSQLEAVIKATSLDPATLIVTPAGKAPLRGPASTHGFVDPVPF